MLENPFHLHLHHKQPLKSVHLASQIIAISFVFLPYWLLISFVGGELSHTCYHRPCQDQVSAKDHARHSEVGSASHHVYPKADARPPESVFPLQRQTIHESLR